MRHLLLMILLLSSVGLKAQSDRRGWSVVPYIGLNTSNVSNTTDQLQTYIDVGKVYDSRRKTGLTAGVDVDYRYLKQLSTTIALSYSDEGYGFELPLTYDTSIRYLYLGALENWHVFGGLALKTGIKCGYRIYNEEWNFPDRWNVVLPIGISYEYWNVKLDLQYNFGLRNIYNDHKKRCTNSLWLTLGYRFNLT